MSINDFLTILKDSYVSNILIGAAVLFIFVALVGGGLQGILQISQISVGQRRVLGIVGAIFLILGCTIAAVPSSEKPPVLQAPTVVVRPTAPSIPAPTDTVVPTPDVAPVSPTPRPTWKIILNRTYNTLKYATYNVVDTKGHHFFIVVVSVENVSSTAQYFSGNLFDLQDEHGYHYSEDQASDPKRSFVVDPGQPLEMDIAFVIPNSSCKLELSFTTNSSVVASWTINSALCS